jgi:hypothetical protein
MIKLDLQTNDFPFSGQQQLNILPQLSFVYVAGVQSFSTGS